MRKKFQIIVIISIFLISVNFTSMTEGKNTFKIGRLQNIVVESNHLLASLAYFPVLHDFGDMERDEVNITTFEIWNAGCCSLFYTLNENEDWVDVNPTSGYSTGEHDTITVTINTANLAFGQHKCNISIITGTENAIFTVFVNIITKDIIDISVEEAWNFLNDISNGIQIPIDVRTDTEWIIEHIDTPYPENPQHHNYLEWDDPSILADFISSYDGEEIILYCKLGGRSRIAANILAENEFNGVIYNMLGGITEWKNQGYPIEGHTTLEIMDFQGEIGSVSFDIKNNGSYDAKNLSYDIRVIGGFFSGIDLAYTCSDYETPLEPEAIITESTKKAGLIFGFGPIEIMVSAGANNAEDISIIKEGFVIGVFIIIK